MRVLMSLRDQNAIQIALSLLSKIQNVLRDESAMELIMPYLNMWPAIPKLVNILFFLFLKITISNALNVFSYNLNLN